MNATLFARTVLTIGETFMTNDPIYNRLRELSWRRELTAAEEAELRAWLAAHPEAQADWEAEAGLNEALRQLPDAPVPSNFTARVLQAVEREAALRERRRGARWRVWHGRGAGCPGLRFAAALARAGVGVVSRGGNGPPKELAVQPPDRSAGLGGTQPGDSRGLRRHPRAAGFAPRPMWSCWRC